MSAPIDLTLPPGGYRPDLWYAFISWISTVYCIDGDRFLSAFDAAGPWEQETHEQPPDAGYEGSLLPAWRIVKYPQWLVVIIQGSTTAEQLWRQFQVERQENYALGPGKVSPFYQGAANAIYAQMSARLTAWAPGRKILVLGHSYGGALALFIGALIRRDLPNQLHAVVTFGSPKAGNANFAAGYNAPCINVLGVDDVITRFPPSGTPVSLAVNLSNLFQGQAVGWTHVAGVFSLDEASVVTCVSNETTYDAAIVSYVQTVGDEAAFDFQLHHPQTYAARLRRLIAPKFLAKRGIVEIATLDAANRSMAEFRGFRLNIGELAPAG